MFYRACKENIFDNCDPSKIPQPNSTKLEGCLKTGDDFTAKVKECKGKSESDACACWSDPSFKTMQDDLKMNCNFTVRNIEPTTHYCNSCRSCLSACFLNIVKSNEIPIPILSFQGEAAAIKTQFKACKSAFGSCRKYEDDVLTSVVSCSKVSFSLLKGY